MEPTVILTLTRADYETLCLMLGMATGSRDGGSLPQKWKDLVDWVMIQGGPDNYTYWNERVSFQRRKLDEVAREGSSSNG